MATSDLCEVLKRHETALEASTERQICAAVLRLLHDKSNDVQAIAVKTLSVLLTTVQPEQVLEIADSLTDQVLDVTKSELRDVYTIGLRTLVQTIPDASLVANRLVGRLLDGIQTLGPEIVLACLDVLNDLIGKSSPTQHEAILHMLLQQLQKDDPLLRKRAGTAMGGLSVVLSDTLLTRMVEALLVSQQHPTALIRTMCTVSSAVGHRLGQDQIDRILPLFFQYIRPEDALNGDEDDEAMDAMPANDLRESCFLGLESLVLRSPNHVEPHLTTIVQAALAYMRFDPNYSYGDDDDDQVEDQDEDMDDDDDDYDDEYEDEEDDYDDEDDDETWKVRRSAIRVLRAVVEALKHHPAGFWTRSYDVRHGHSTRLAVALVGRFKEREENCRVGVIDCFARLVEVTVDAEAMGTVSFGDMETDSAIDLQQEYVPKTVKACEKIFAVKKGNERSKSSCLSLLVSLCKAPGGLGGKEAIGSIFKHAEGFLVSTADSAIHREGTSKALRLDALSLVYAILSSGTHDPVHIRVNLRDSLLPELCDAVQEQWYKVIAEALRALACVPLFFVQGYTDEDEATRNAERKQVVDQSYKAIEPLLAAHDVDQEIKECALTASASLLSYLHGCMSNEQRAQLLSLMLERLRNESTRIAAIRTLSSIASAGSSDGMDESSPVDLSTILTDAISTMSSFLKLQSRSTKQVALEALDVVVSHHGSAEAFSDGTLYSGVVEDLAPLIAESDLHISHLASYVL